MFSWQQERGTCTRHLFLLGRVPHTTYSSQIAVWAQGGWQGDAPGVYAGEHSALAEARRAVGMEVRASMGAAQEFGARDAACCAGPSSSAPCGDVGDRGAAAPRRSGQGEALLSAGAPHALSSQDLPLRSGQSCYGTQTRFALCGFNGPSAAALL